MKLLFEFSIKHVMLCLCLVTLSLSHVDATTVVSSPVNGAVGVRPDALIITAKLVSGAPSYKIDISTSMSFATIFQTHTGIGTNSQGFTDLAYGTRYYVRVSVDGGTTYGMTTSFITATPVAATPVNGSLGMSPASVTVVSKNVPGASTYTIELSTSNTFASIFKTLSGSSTQNFKDLAYGIKYYVRIKTDLVKSDLSPYGYGPVTSFTIAPLVATSPVNGMMGTGPASVTVTSTLIPGANEYTIELSTSSTFMNIFKSQTGPNSQIFTDLAYGMKYYVRVKTDLLKSDQSSFGYGKVTSFTTASPVITSPVNGTMSVNPSFVTLTSSTVPGANTYTIELSTTTNFVNFISHSGSNSQGFSVLMPSTKYYARVKTDLVRSDSSSYGYGKITSFTTGVMPAAALQGTGLPGDQTSAEFAVNVFSNPTKDVFKLRVDSNNEVSFSVYMFDTSSGAQVHTSVQKPNEVVELGRELKAGKYVIHVSTPTGVKSYHVVKE